MRVQLIMLATIITTAAASSVAGSPAEPCDRVALDARAIMTARQFGLSYHGARLHLAKDSLKAELVNAAYQFPVESGNLKPFEAIDAFSADWRNRCLTSNNDQK